MQRVTVSLWDNLPGQHLPVESIQTEDKSEHNEKREIIYLAIKKNLDVPRTHREITKIAIGKKIVDAVREILRYKGC